MKTITDIAKKLIEAYDNNEKVNLTKVRLFQNSKHN